MDCKRFKPEIFLVLLIIVGATISEGKLLTRLRSGLHCHTTEAGYHRDEVSCKKFYYCPGSSPSDILNDEDKPIYMKILADGFECPDGTLFDETISECDRIGHMKVIPVECSKE